MNGTRRGPFSRKLGRWLALFAAVVTLFLLLSPLECPGSPPSLPNGAFAHLDGHSVILSDFDSPVVVNLWATWCVPCRRELPLMTEMAAQHPEVTFVFVNQRESGSRVSQFLAEMRDSPNWLLLDPKGELADQFQSLGLPTTLFFDESGTLTQAHLGELSSVELFNAVTDLQR